MHRGRNYRAKTQDAIHQFFLKNCPELDTIHLNYQKKHYSLRSMLDQPETYGSRKKLRAELSQQSGGAWIEEENGNKRYFVDKGWLFFRPQELTKEDFEAYRPSSVFQKTNAFVLGALAIGPAIVETARHIPIADAAAMLACARSSPGAGILGLALSRLNSAYAQTPTPTPVMPMPGEFRINTNTTNSQLYPSIAPLPKDGFFVAWQGDQTGDNDIYGQIFDAVGNTLGSEFRINNNTANNQLYPVLAILSEGDVESAWSGSQTGLDNPRSTVNA